MDLENGLLVASKAVGFILIIEVVMEALVKPLVSQINLDKKWYIYITAALGIATTFVFQVDPSILTSNLVPTSPLAAQIVIGLALGIAANKSHDAGDLLVSLKEKVL